MPEKTDPFIDFELTADDIRRSKPSHGASSCPVATCLARTTGNFALVGWLGATIYWGDKKKITKTYEKNVGTNYNFDRATTERIKRYDDSGYIAPFKGRMTRV